MDRLAVGLMIALFALVLNGGLVKDVLAEDTSRLALSHGQAVPSRLSSPDPGVSRSSRIASMLVALEALGAVPGALDTRSR